MGYFITLSIVALYNHNFPVPKPIDHCRHTVLMSKCQGIPMTRIRMGDIKDLPRY